MKSKWTKLLAAVTSGALLGLAFPPWNLEFMVWIWALPLLWALWCGERAEELNTANRGRLRSLASLPFCRAAALGLIAGMVWGLISLNWVRHSSRVINGAYGDEWMGWGVELLGWGAVVGLSLYCAAYVAIWAGFVDTVARPHKDRLSSTSHSVKHAFLAAASWVALEWVRGWMLTGFGWNGLGVALIENKALIQAAELVGVAGLSFVPMLVACLAFITGWRLIRQFKAGERLQRRWDLTAGIVLLGAQLIYGMLTFTNKEEAGVTIRTALVQQNVPQMDRWMASPERLTEIYQRYADLTKLYAKDVDLVVWPESGLILTWYHPDHPAYLNGLLSQGDFTLLSGVDLDEPTQGVYNAAVMLKSDIENAKFYLKTHLVPFGEYVPGRTIIPGVDAVFRAILPGDITPGTSYEPLRLSKPDVDLIPLICFEDTVGRVARKFVRTERPQLIVNMTNDGWFLNSVENTVHLNNAILRCVELRRPMVRAANTGVTAVIDERGIVTDRLHDPQTGSPFIQGVLPARISLATKQPMTLYSRWGDWFAGVMMLLCFGAIITHIRSSKSMTN
ncbi:MAG: apolipoprotein N-acyltransferase [Verrucomicrobiaceae bacterium]|nr:apolipoprotein N-acyltransferase [Verrucomicrobiaceae bacterium]